MHPSRMCPAYREVLAAVARNECQIVPSIYDRRFGPHATEHAFAFAFENGLIEVTYTDVLRRPVYQAAGVADEPDEHELEV